MARICRPARYVREAGEGSSKSSPKYTSNPVQLGIAVGGVLSSTPHSGSTSHLCTAPRVVPWHLLVEYLSIPWYIFSKKRCVYARNPCKYCPLRQSYAHRGSFLSAMSAHSQAANIRLDYQLSPRARRGELFFPGFSGESRSDHLPVGTVSQAQNPSWVQLQRAESTPSPTAPQRPHTAPIPPPYRPHTAPGARGHFLPPNTPKLR